MYISSFQDPNGFLYCVKHDEVRHGSTLDCSLCPHFRGSIQGAGRECEVGEDDREVTIRDPFEYMDSKHKDSEVEVVDAAPGR